VKPETSLFFGSVHRHAQERFLALAKIVGPKDIGCAFLGVGEDNPFGPFRHIDTDEIRPGIRFAGII